MNRSESINEISAALAKAQGEMSNPGFDSTNPHFRSKFASLASVRNAVVPVLAKHNLTLTQEVSTTERGIACLTILTHSSGQWMEFGPLEMPAGKQDAQGFGSAATYARRYSMMAVAGVVGDEDDDGNAAASSVTAAKQAAQKVVNANVAPTAGLLDAFPADVQQQLRDWAAEIQEAYDKAGAGPASEIWEDAVFDKEHKAAAWSLLDSKCRSAIKKRKAEAQVATADQA